MKHINYQKLLLMCRWGNISLLKMPHYPLHDLLSNVLIIEGKWYGDNHQNCYCYVLIKDGYHRWSRVENRIQMIHVYTLITKQAKNSAHQLYFCQVRQKMKVSFYS